MDILPHYIHSLEWAGEPLPTAFTYPFRYEPHPLCRKAATLVQSHLEEMSITEPKMFGVLVASDNSESAKGQLFFLAAYSGQLDGSYDYPWFVPPVFDYLDPNGYFMQEQARIVSLSEQLAQLNESEELKALNSELALLVSERDEAISVAKNRYEEGRKQRNALRAQTGLSQEQQANLVLESQRERADIMRAKQKHKDEIAQLEEKIRAHECRVKSLVTQRKERSESLQEWLFHRFRLLNQDGECKDVVLIFKEEGRRIIPSGTGECCAPKLLQAAYTLQLKPLCMAEFWWNPLQESDSRSHLTYYPSCHQKCRPLLRFMLRGLTVESSPALHYDKVNSPMRMIWEDEYLAIVEKPAGMLSQPGRSDQRNLFDECLNRWPDIEGQVIVHRLDQDTSGIMVVAKTSRAHHFLRKLFESREVEKEYVALLEGQVSVKDGLISLPLAPDVENSPRQKVDYEVGVEAVTEYRVLGTELVDGKLLTRVLFRPLTGRTHQLRVHAASRLGLDSPIYGDRLYGHLADRLYLHATSLSFIHPFTHERMRWEAPPPF